MRYIVLSSPEGFGREQDHRDVSCRLGCAGQACDFSMRDRRAALIAQVIGACAEVT